VSLIDGAGRPINRTWGNARPSPRDCIVNMAVVWLNPEPNLHLLLACEQLNSVKQSVFLHDTFVTYPSWKKCGKKFNRNYPNAAVYPVNRWFTKSWQNFVQPHECLTRKKAHSDRGEIGQGRDARSDASSKASLRRVAFQCGESNSAGTWSNKTA
jgi:hypothetical protein